MEFSSAPLCLEPGNGACAGKADARHGEQLLAPNLPLVAPRAAVTWAGEHPGRRGAGRTKESWNPRLEGTPGMIQCGV